MSDEYTIKRIAPLVVGSDAWTQWLLEHGCTRVETMSYEEYRRRFAPVTDTSGRLIAPPQTEPPARPRGPWDGNGDNR